MNNKQQTAVEYYSKEIGRLTSDLITGKITGKQFVMLEIQLFDQAKEMDKEQKIRDFTDGYLYRGEQLRPWLIDKWYKETYGGGEQ
jgi:hypothetical protein